MSIKLGVDYITPLFVAIDMSMEGEVVIICDISMKAEAEGILSHLGIYIALVFGSVAWEAFTVSYKASMEPYQYCPIRCCAIERFVTYSREIPGEFPGNGEFPVIVGELPSCKNLKIYDFIHD